MQGEAEERWKMLCKLAAEEQDPKKLLELAAAIDRLRKEKFDRPERQQFEETDDKAAGCPTLRGSSKVGISKD